MKPTRTFIGIDPDVHKSGVAIVRDGKLESYSAQTFFDVIKTIEDNNSSPYHEVQVIIEAGWLNKRANWHASANQWTAQRIAKNVGANHQIGKLFEEYCKRIRAKYELVVPKQHKYTPEFVSSVVGAKVRNQDVCDAIMLVLGRKS